MMRPVQRVLLAAYSAVQRTGIHKTAVGRYLFERAYWAYKSLLEARDLRTLQRYVVPASTVIDVGANIGFFTVPFCRWVGVGGRVVGIEPEPENFRSLQHRIRRLGLEDRALLVNAAAAEEPGHVNLQLNPDNPADHRIAQSGLRVEAVSIDRFLEAQALPPVSLVKIDVQGGELRVIRGARALLATAKPALFVEFDEQHLADGGTSGRQLLDEVASLGYAPYVLKDGGWVAVGDEELFARMRARGYIDVVLLAAGGDAGAR